MSHPYRQRRSRNRHPHGHAHPAARDPDRAVFARECSGCLQELAFLQFDGSLSALVVLLQFTSAVSLFVLLLLGAQNFKSTGVSRTLRHIGSELLLCSGMATVSVLTVKAALAGRYVTVRTLTDLFGHGCTRCDIFVLHQLL